MKSHIKHLVKKTIEELHREEMSKALDSVSGMKDELSKIMNSEREVEMLDVMCDTIVDTLNINGTQQ